MSNFFIAIGVFLITIIGALFAVPYMVDWNGYRSVFEEEATRLLGRDVRVGGAVNLHLLPTPYFRFEKVRIADTSVNLQEPFFRADSLTVKLAIPPMIRGLVEANEVELQRPVLRVAVDNAGAWNWQSFGQTLGKSVYLPGNVALTSVKITDGTLAVHGADGAERTRFEGFNGELSAPALDGPYRVRGTFGGAGAQRELRIGTSRPEADGTIRFKAILRDDAAPSTFSLDGRLADLTGKPHVEGELTARVPASALWQQPGSKAAGAEKGAAAFDLRAALNADPWGAMLTNLALSFEQDGRPQLLTGDLRAQWRDALSVEMSLASRWLDLDRIAGVSENAAPLDSVVPLAIGMRDLLPAGSRSRAAFAIDQASIGHEAVSGLRLTLARTDDKLVIEEFRLGLPGGSRAELQGVVIGSADGPMFDGTVGVRGTSLVRFLGWASAGALTFDAKGDGTFGVRSQVSIGSGHIAARNIIGDLSGTTISAAAQYRWGGRPELSLSIDGPQLDARAFIPAASSLGDIFDSILHGPLMGQGAPRTTALGTPTALRGPQADTSIRLNAGQLITAGRTYRDVALEAELRGGRLRLPLLRVSGDEGFSLEIEGEVDDAAARPKGTLRGLASADSAAGMASLVELLGMPDSFRPDARRAQAMAPLRLAGSMAFGRRTPTSADIMLDGEANGVPAKLSARLDGGAGGWRSGPADVTGLMETNNAKALADALAPGSVTGRAEPGAGRLVFRATGVPGDGMVSLASVEAGDVALNFRGRLTAGDSGNSATGDVEIKAQDAGRFATLVRLSPPLRLDGLPVSGSFNLAVDSRKITLDRMALNLNGNDIRGQLSIANVGERRRLEARIEVDELAMSRMLALIQDQRLAVASIAETAVSGRQSVWSDEPFDASVLDAFEGSVKLSARRLVVADGIALSGVRFDAALKDGRIEVKQLDGACLGGRCTATVNIAKAAGGAEVSGSLTLTGGAIEALGASGAGKSRASGTISGEIKFSGKGTSPRGVFSVLQGGGTLAFSDARLTALWPGAIPKAVDAALKSEPDGLPATVKSTLAADLAGGDLPLPAQVDLEIADGRLAAKPFAIDTPEGRAQATASIDLKSLLLEADWRLEQKPGAGPADKAPLPGITVSYRGNVAALGGLEPRINSDALERELAVRRMERDVEELERLRRLDETRRREEADRQRRQLEQAPLPPPGPVAPAPRPATPG